MGLLAYHPDEVGRLQRRHLRGCQAGDLRRECAREKNEQA